MSTIIARYFTLIGLLLTVVWIMSDASWEPRAAFFLVFAAYIGTDVFAYSNRDSDNRTKADTLLYEKFISEVPSEGSVNFIRTHDMGGAFHRNALDQLDLYWHKHDNVELEFLDETIEQKRVIFSQAVEAFMLEIASNTFADNDFQSVPREWRHEQPEKFLLVVGELNILSEKVVRAHQDFVRTARKRLNL